MRKVLFVCNLLIGLYCYGQNNIEISIQQDARLFFLGDKKGNDALTINLLSRVEFPVYSFKKNHLIASFSIEYADLVKKNYTRYAFGAGYVVKSIYKKVGAGAYIDFGKIYRQEEGFYSLSFSGELNYRINDRLKFICTSQFTQRKDLTVLYNSEKKYIHHTFTYNCRGQPKFSM